MNNSLQDPLGKHLLAYRKKELGAPTEESRYSEQKKLDETIAFEKGLYYHYDRLDNTTKDYAPEDNLVITKSPLYGLRNRAELDSSTDPVTGEPTEAGNLMERVHHNGRPLHLNTYWFSGQQINSLEITARGENGAILEERLLVANDPAASVYRRWVLQDDPASS